MCSGLAYGAAISCPVALEILWGQNTVVISEVSWSVKSAVILQHSDLYRGSLGLPLLL